MKSWCIQNETGPDGLALIDRPEPEVAGREILVEIESTAMNRADLLQALGRYPVRSAGPAVPGLEFAGRVLARGPEARAFAPGDRVLGLCDGGAFAERIALDERLLMTWPPALAAAEAGAFAEAFLTAFDALVRQGGLGAGDLLVVQAAASGVGCAALLIARELGARAIACCSPAKAAAVSALGATEVLDSRSPRLAEELRAACGGGGAQVVLEMIGAPSLAASLGAAAPGGRVVLIGLLGGARAEVDLGLILKKGLILRGSLLRPRSVAEKGAIIRDFQATLGEAFAAGRLRPPLHRTFEFAELPRALAVLAGNENVGKVAVLRGPVGENP
ncbi:MAG: zinc-binding dehydrogenase [Planctomycetes bacterium]|nr:zinc-binding dehydrogenase [Planctomycetota bacterium]